MGAVVWIKQPSLLWLWQITINVALCLVKPPRMCDTMSFQTNNHPDLQVVGGWHCWHVQNRSVPPSLLSAGPPVSNTSSSEPRSPSCAAISRCEGQRSIHRLGYLFQPKLPSLACRGSRLTASENYGLRCRTSCRQGGWMFPNFG